MTTVNFAFGVAYSILREGPSILTKHYGNPVSKFWRVLANATAVGHGFSLAEKLIDKIDFSNDPHATTVKIVIKLGAAFVAYGATHTIINASDDWIRKLYPSLDW